MGVKSKKESKDRLMSESHHFLLGGLRQERKKGRGLVKSGKSGGCRATTEMGKRGQRKGKGGIERVAEWHW